MRMVQWMNKRTLLGKREFSRSFSSGVTPAAVQLLDKGAASEKNVTVVSHSCGKNKGLSKYPTGVALVS